MEVLGVSQEYRAIRKSKGYIHSFIINCLSTTRQRYSGIVRRRQRLSFIQYVGGKDCVDEKEDQQASSHTVVTYPQI
jgi:hypothetical protein